MPDGDRVPDPGPYSRFRELHQLKDTKVGVGGGQLVLAEHDNFQERAVTLRRLPDGTLALPFIDFAVSQAQLLHAPQQPAAVEHQSALQPVKANVLTKAVCVVRLLGLVLLGLTARGLLQEAASKAAAAAQPTVEQPQPPPPDEQPAVAGGDLGPAAAEEGMVR